MTIMFMLAITSEMSRTHLPFVICKSCLAAFDVDLGDKIRNTRNTLGIGRKRRLDANVESRFEARCAYCKKLSEYSKGDTLWNTDLSSGDAKLAEMMHAENIELRSKIREVEVTVKAKAAEIVKLEKDCEKLANTIDKMKVGVEKPYKRGRSNPLSS